MVPLTNSEYGAFTRFIYELTGAVVDRAKTRLIEGRLLGLLRSLGCGTYSELFYKVRNDTAGALKNAVIDRITLQDTSFFRDPGTFEMLERDVLPARHRFSEPSRKLGIWSAACSTGQETYSIAMTIKHAWGDLKAVSILGTDISDAAVSKAAAGVYTSDEVGRGLSADRVRDHFEREENRFRVSDELRAPVRFRKLNLHEDFEFLGQWDVIFCRNVASDFSETDRKNLFDRLHAALGEGGVLIIGSKEPLLGICPSFTAHRYGRSVFYTKG